jgi:phosphoribosyl-AMP cyclohydrolase
MTAAAVFPAPGSKAALETGSLLTPRFDADGLIPAIVTDAGDGAVLMFAWMNADALAHTLTTGTVQFWSRSRGRLWIKGEDSGNTLELVDMRIDCDQDVLLVRARLPAQGVACHTGQRSCFYRTVDHRRTHADGTYGLVAD